MDRFRGSAPVAPVLTIDQVELYTWFERDRACVELRRIDNDQTVFELWDDAVHQAVEDGYLEMNNLKQSTFDYAQELGAIG